MRFIKIFILLLCIISINFRETEVIGNEWKEFPNVKANIMPCAYYEYNILLNKNEAIIDNAHDFDGFTVLYKTDATNVPGYDYYETTIDEGKLIINNKNDRNNIKDIYIYLVPNNILKNNDYCTGICTGGYIRKEDLNLDAFYIGKIKKQHSYDIYFTEPFHRDSSYPSFGGDCGYIKKYAKNFTYLYHITKIGNKYKLKLTAPNIIEQYSHIKEGIFGHLSGSNNKIITTFCFLFAPLFIELLIFLSFGIKYFKINYQIKHKHLKIYLGLIGIIFINTIIPILFYKFIGLNYIIILFYLLIFLSSITTILLKYIFSKDRKYSIFLGISCSIIILIGYILRRKLSGHIYYHHNYELYTTYIQSP